MEVWRIYTYDVWGNANDGYEVNDVFRTSDIVEVASNADTATILAALDAANLIDAGYSELFTIDESNEDTIYFERSNDGKPVAEIRREDHK
jgi:hypothetical protein